MSKGIYYYYLQSNTVANNTKGNSKCEDKYNNPLKICQLVYTKMDNRFMNSVLHAK